MLIRIGKELQPYYGFSLSFIATADDGDFCNIISCIVKLETIGRPIIWLSVLYTH